MPRSMTSSRSATRRVVRAFARGAAAAARELSVQEPPAPPAGLAEDLLYATFLAQLGCLALVVLQVDTFLPGSWAPPIRLAMGIALLAGAITFLPARVGARPLLVARRASGRRRRARRFLLDSLIQLAALAMLVGAVFELVRAIPEYI